jgi:hypothetical protein
MAFLLQLIWEIRAYTIALLIKGRSGGTSTKHLYRSGTSSTADHILFLTSGTTPNLRHQPSSGGTVTITSSVAIVNDTTWSTLVGTWRQGRLELYVDGFSRASSTATATNTSTAGAGGSRRRRTSTATSHSSRASPQPGPRHGAAVARRSVRLPAPVERAACAHGERATVHAPSTGTGVVTFLMG